MKKISTLLLWLLCSFPLFSQTIYYVKTTGSDANSGTSWATAFKTVQKAINTITTGQIWVAAGTYYPDEGTGQTNNNRDAYFTLKAEVALYGGFAGTETALGQRNLAGNKTILSGDIDGNGAFSNNTFVVVRSNGVNHTAILDGFTITWGYAETPAYEGGGMKNEYSSPTIRNCRFVGNKADFGGGMLNKFASPTITNCTFYGNAAGATRFVVDGGAMSNWSSSPTIINCTFYGNTSTDKGGGIYNWSSTTTISNSIVWGNSPDQVSGDDAAVTYSIVQGGYIGTGNKDENPQFVDTTGGDFHLQFCSPAIEGGNNAVVAGIATDGDGAPRISFHKVDMGAYESQASRVVYVKARAMGLKNGTSWVNAFTSLQDALAKWPGCQAPFEIWVAAGTYYPDEKGLTNSNLPTASFELRNNVALYGGFPAIGSPRFADRNWTNHTTILSGEIQQDDAYSNNAYHVVRSTSVNATALLDGFTITGGNANASGNNQGGGLYNASSSPTVIHCSFEGNRAAEGGALYNHVASPTLTDCQFLWNGAKYGGAIYNYNNTPVLTGCRFGGNTASLDGGGIYNNSVSSSTLTNCSFWGNEAAAGGGLNNFFSSNVKLTNCTLAANTAGDGGGIYNWVASPTLTNCILWGNSTGQISGDGATVTYSIVQGGHIGTGNKNTNPQLVDAAGGQLQLRGCSPAVNAATATGAPTTDAVGAPRPALGGYDMGAYELQGNGAPSIFFVNKNAPGPLHDGSSWANAFTTLQPAIDQAATCFTPSQVWVTANTYYPDATGTDRYASFVLHDNVAVYGGFTGTEVPTPNLPPARTNKTVLSGDIQQDINSTNNSYHVVLSSENDSTALLDGFIITGGYANGSSIVVMSNGSAPPTDNLGAGFFMYRSSPTITNCIIHSNQATFMGGGVAAINFGTPVLTNCLFYNNSAERGGGMATSGSFPEIINCTFSDNTATEGGAIHNTNASTAIMNSIIWGNSGGQIYGTAQVIYSIVQNGSYSGTGNKTTDPKFFYEDTGYLHLQSGSPAIDAGNKDFVATIFGDLDGKPRVQGTQVDMGAYEYPQASPPVTLPPHLLCPASYTLFSDPDRCGAIADFTGPHAATASSKEGPVTITYAPASGTLLPVGEQTITVTATDTKGESSACSFTVTVIDTTPPLVGCPAVAGLGFLGEVQPLIKATDPEACTYTIKGTELDVQATDNCPAPLTYFFSLDGATTSWGPVEASSLENLQLNAGRTTITWVVQDAAGNQSSCHFDVLVIDRTPPQISTVSATPSVLYPPNHKMQLVEVTYTATDNCAGFTTTLSVTGNEPPYATGSGDTGPDWEIIDNHRVLLRAERSGTGTGRIYTITVTARDAAGNESTATTTVTVPHDKGAPVTTNEAINSKDVNSLVITAVPNPSTEGFTLTVQSPPDLPLSIKVMDGAGRIIEQRSRLAPNGVLYLGTNYRPGVYYLQVLQGSVVQTLKLIKQAR